MNTVNRYANTSMVEEFLLNILTGTVSDHVYPNTLPSAIGNDWNDMVLVDCDLPMVDYGNYTQATVYIYLYARPRTNGTKNGALLAQLENKLCDVLDTVKDAHYAVNRLSNGADYDTNIQWHRNYVYFNLIITK